MPENINTRQEIMKGKKELAHEYANVLATKG